MAVNVSDNHFICLFGRVLSTKIVYQQNVDFTADVLDHSFFNCFAFDLFFIFF